MPINSKSTNASSPIAKVQDVPDMPTIGTATASALTNAVSVDFTPAATGGRAYQYRAISSPGNIEAVAFSSPVLMPVSPSGLTYGTSYTFRVRGETNLGATTGYTAASNSVTAINTYELISTQLVTNNSTVVVLFNNIPQGYRHLQVRMTTRVSQTNATARDCSVYLNGYSPSRVNAWHNLQGNGSNIVSQAQSSVQNIYLPPTSTAQSPSNVFNSAIMDLLDYQSTSKNKTVRIFGGLHSGSNFVNLRSGFTVDLNPITSLEFSTDDGSIFWAAGSRFSLYGIRG